MATDIDVSCPLPISRYEQVILGHGSGGRLTAELIRNVFLPSFSNPYLDRQEDQASLPFPTELEGGSRLAFTTDSFVIRPIFFPGGDIGKLAVCGTINDLAVGGAKPLYLSAAFIIEEGLAISDLARIAQSMRDACQQAGVLLVTGDTKVVERGKGDQIFITTSGIGVIPSGRDLSMAKVRPGDHILVSGTIGDHGMAIMAVREGMDFETALESDCADLSSLTQSILEPGDSSEGIRWMRDPTRGGVGGVLHELATSAAVGVELEESKLPIDFKVRGVCEILGLDPLFVANEGKLVAVVAPEQSERILASMRRHPLGKFAARIGEVVAAHPGMMTLRSVIGGERVITLFAGEQLPRIC